jgi:hypothetical protein
MFRPVAFYRSKAKEQFEEFILTIGENRLIRKWDLNGNQDTTGNWPINVNSPAVRITSLDYSFDEQIFMIVGHRGVQNSASGYEAFDLNGNSIFSNGSLANTDPRTIAVEPNGDFYVMSTGTNPGDNSPIRKFDKNNNSIWTRNLTNTARTFGSYYYNGKFAVGQLRSSNLTTVLMFSDNSVITEFDCGGNVGDVAFNDDVLITTPGNTIRKYDLVGLTRSLHWTYDHGAITRGVLLTDDAVYFAANRISNISHRKLGLNGTLIWSRDHGNQGTFRDDNSIDIDSEGNIWFSFERASNISHRKYSPDGDLLVSIDHGVSGNGVKVIRKKI